MVEGCTRRPSPHDYEFAMDKLKNSACSRNSPTTRDFRSSSEQLRRLFSLARSTCGAVQNVLSLLFLVLGSVSCRRYLPCHGSALPTAPQALGILPAQRAFSIFYEADRLQRGTGCFSRGRR